MKKTINQIEFVKYELNEKINALISSQSMEGKIIADINDISYQNKVLAKEISEVIVTRALQERSALNKLKILYVIDSIIKNMGNEFIFHLSNYIFKIFEEAYVISDEESRISLFKLFYSWKYFLKQNILESISNRFNLNEMKRYLQKEKPELIEKYDKFNEGVRENIMKEMGTTNNNINLINENINSNSAKLTQTPIASSFEKKSMKESFLKELKSQHQKERKNLDEYFSSSSYSRDDSDSNEDDRRKSKHVGHHNSNKSNRKVSNFNEDRDRKKKLINSDLKRKSNHYATHKKERNEIRDLTKSNQDKSHRIHRVDKIDRNDNIDIHSPSTEDINKIATKEQIQQLMPNLPQWLNQVATLINRYSTPNQINTNLTNLTELSKGKEFMNLIQHSQPMKQKIAPVESTHIIPHSTVTSLPSLQPLNSFIHKSTINPKQESQLFSTISEFFHRSIHENKDVQNKSEILKLKDFNQHKDLIKKTLESISTDLKNVCTICGFRTKIYPQFVEHLDIHFQINFIKRNSLKKVLYRKESLNKNNWINPEEDSNFNRNLIKNSFTLNSVLFYQNDTDHLITNKKDIKGLEENEDNEQMIVPVQFGEDINCVYCGEEFKKKYLNKFHYWFYVNVVKFNQNEIVNFGEIIKLNEKNDYVIIHESCIEEFFKMVRYREKENDDVHFLKEKRLR